MISGVLVVEYYGETDRDLEQEARPPKEILIDKRITMTVPPLRVMDLSETTGGSLVRTEGRTRIALFHSWRLQTDTSD